MGLPAATPTSFPPQTRRQSAAWRRQDFLGTGSKAGIIEKIRGKKKKKKRAGHLSHLGSSEGKGTSEKCKRKCDQRKAALPAKEGRDTNNQQQQQTICACGRLFQDVSAKGSVTRMTRN